MKIGILGAGTWGTALARMLCLDGKSVVIWSAIEKEIDELSKTRVHPNLANMKIPEEIVFTKNIKEACENVDIVVFAVPSVFIRSVAKSAKEYISKDTIVVNVSKGIELDTLKTMTEIIDEELVREKSTVALSGPTHAEEVSKDLPTTIVSASYDSEKAKIVQDVFSNGCMRVYTNDDVLGVELCGALKNIVALATGISSGLGNGDNAKAALITRGIAEMSRLGMAMGCDMRTFYGLAGVGDLIVTSTSMHSRNNRAGVLIGKGYSTSDAVKQVGMVVEGINALPAAIKLAEKYNVEMPIISAVDAIVNRGVSPKELVGQLMTREYKNEVGELAK